MLKERVLITVKTYPTISEKYKELACTAGFREDGSWIRLYPIPFRLLKEDKRYSKYQWIEVDVEKNKGDPRPESYRVPNTQEIKLLQKIGTSREWEDRKKIVLEKTKVYTNKKEIISLAHKDKISLAVFKPSKIVDFIIEDADPEWPQHKVNGILSQLKQGSLFEDQNIEDFKMMPKLPKKFSYIFEDDLGERSTLMIEDWEVGSLYWNCLKKSTPDAASKKVKEKYFDDFALKKDLYFFLGTTREWHIRRARNPYVIIGTFHPPIALQPSLF